MLEPPSVALTGSLQIQLLGGFDIELDGRRVHESAFARRKAIALLKLLALQPARQFHRDQVIDLLWPDLSSNAGGAQLYKAIHHVRQALLTCSPPVPVEELLFLRGELLGLAAPNGVVVDADTFEAAAATALATRDLNLIREALDLYRGDILPSDLYEDWAAPRRDALKDLAIDLLLELGQGLLATGQPSEAADALRQVIARDVAREEAHRALMLAYARQGNRSRALRQFDTCVDVMQAELGVPVSAETLQLQQDIRAGRVPRAETLARPVLAEVAIHPHIVGRSCELHTIQHVLDRLASGQGGVVGICGPAGVGKSRLAQEVLRLGWRRRWHIMSGATHEQEGQIPYLPFIEAIRHALQIDPAHASLIPPELAQSIPEMPQAAEITRLPDRLAAQHALFAAVLRFLLARAAAAPVILVLDDLHAMDDGSLKLFHYLARESRKLPLLIIGCWRHDEPEQPSGLTGIIDSLTRRDIMQVMALRPLDETEHRSLIEQAIGRGRVDPLLAGQLYASSEGNPLFAREIAAQLIADGTVVESHGIWRLTSQRIGTDQALVPAIPGSLRTLVATRLEALSADAGRLIHCASVVGRNIPLDLLRHMLHTHAVSETAMLDRLDEALASGLLVETGLDVRFPHGLLRAAVYDGMSSARRRSLHAEAAAAIERLHTGELSRAPVEALAHHFLLAGNVQRAVHYLTLAGDHASAVYDHDSAIERFERALRALHEAPEFTVPGRASALLERVGDAHRSTGNIDASLSAYRAALDALVGLDPGENRSRRHTLLHKTTLNAILVADLAAATTDLELTRALVGPEPATQSRHHILEALYLWHCLQFEAAIAHAQQALEIAEAAELEIEASQACEMLAIAYMPLGNWKESLHYELRRRSADWSPEIVVAVDAHLCLYQYKLHNEESLAEIRSFIDAVAEQASNVGNLRCLAVCHFMLAYLALLQGQPDIAASSALEAIDLHERIGSPAGVAYSIVQQAELLIAAGVHGPVTDLIERGMASAERSAIRDHCLTQMHTVGVRSLIAAGNVAGAGKLVGAALDHNDACRPCAVCQVDLYTTLGEYHVANGAPRDALDYVAAGLALADPAQNGPGRGRLLRVCGQARAALGEESEAERCFTEAASIFDNAGDRYDLALTLREHAALDMARDRPTLLERADDILRRYQPQAVHAAIPRHSP